MDSLTLGQIALLLAAVAIAAPLAKALKIGTVLGFIFAGVLIGPYGLGRLAGIGIGDKYSVSEVLHVAEFGVVLLLFLIGLELRLQRLWTMRTAIFGAGGLQVLISGIVIGLSAYLLGMGPWAALFVGLALSLSSTAFALQVMEENNELGQRHGRLGFAILLFQDLAAIPLIALASLFAVRAGAEPTATVGTAKIATAVAAIGGVLLAGRFLVDPFFRFVAASRMKDALTAAALLVVVVVVLVMQTAGLSASLGAFLAGVVLADSAYRHQIEADIRPFEGLLLGVFFTAIGMSLDMLLVARSPLTVLALTAGLLVIKSLVIYGVGRQFGLDARPSRRLAFSISQGGEFAFVLLSAGVASTLLEPEHAALAAVVVTVSMMMTPALLSAEQMLWRRQQNALVPEYDALPDNDGHVIVAGYGRVGQIVSRVLRGRQIPFTALDIDAEQIAAVQKFGAKAYFGDASRPDILEAAQAGKARAFVLAIDNVEASLRTAAAVRLHYPALPIYARARNRRHVHELMDLGVDVIHRETFSSSIELTADLLNGLGLPKERVASTLQIFREMDEKRLKSDYAHFTDVEKMRQRALASTDELEKLLDQDAAAQAVAEGTASPLRPAGSPGPPASGS